MKNKLLKVLLAITFAASLIGCASKEETTAVPTQEETEEASIEVVEEATTEAPVETEEETTEEQTDKPSRSESVVNTPTELSDDIYAFQVSVDGIVYQFPMWASDFEALGFTYDGDFSDTLSSNQYATTQVWDKGEGSVYTRLANLSMNTVTFAESMVAGITFDEFQLRDVDWEIMLPKGIQYGVATRDDIIAAYGEPSDEYDGSAFNRLTYEYDYHQTIDLYVSKDTGVLNQIDMENMIELEGADNSVSSDVPEIVTAYKEPDSLGEDLYQFNIELEGNLYTLPCPVSELLTNGFTINENNSDSEFAAGNAGWLELRYNNQSYRCLVRNYADYATTAENCFLTTMESSVYDPDFELTIPCGIKRGDKEEDVVEKIKAFNYEKEVSDSGSFTYYTVVDPAGYPLDSFTIITKEGEVVTIEISNSQKPE